MKHYLVLLRRDGEENSAIAVTAASDAEARVEAKKAFEYLVARYTDPEDQPTFKDIYFEGVAVSDTPIKWSPG